MAALPLPGSKAEISIDGFQDLPTDLVLAAFKHLHIVDVEHLAQLLLCKVTEPSHRNKLIHRCHWLLHVHNIARLFRSDEDNSQGILEPSLPDVVTLDVLEGEIKTKARVETFGLSDAYLQAMFSQEPAASESGQGGYGSTTQVRLQKSPPDPASWGIELNGSLGWLQSPPKGVLPGSKSSQSPNPQLWASRLQQEVSYIPELRLPPGFINFMSRAELYQRIPSSQGWYFCLGDNDAQFRADRRRCHKLYELKGIYTEDPEHPEHTAPREIISCDFSPLPFPRLLVKVRVGRPENEQHHGYIVLFHQDPERKVYTYLYLDLNGLHCVLTLHTNYYEETPQSSNSPRSWANDLDEGGICGSRVHALLVSLLRTTSTHITSTNSYTLEHRSTFLD